MLLNLKKGIALMSGPVDLFPWSESYAYGLYLAQTYYYVSHSTQLLALSAGMMKSSDLPFHRRFLDHASEEKGHEMMLLNDLKALGYQLSHFPELSETRMFWEPQFYKIVHNDPLSLMGYIMALEAVATEQCPRIKTILQKHYPEAAYQFIKVHGEDDPEHVQKACQLIASLPPERRKWVEENFEQSVVSFQNMVFSIMRQLKEKELVNVA